MSIESPPWAPGAHLLAEPCTYLECLDAGEEPLCLEVEEDEECVSVVRHLVAHAAAADAVATAEVAQEHQQRADAGVELLKVG